MCTLKSCFEIPADPKQESGGVTELYLSVSVEVLPSNCMLCNPLIVFTSLMLLLHLHPVCWQSVGKQDKDLTFIFIWVSCLQAQSLILSSS